MRRVFWMGLLVVGVVVGLLLLPKRSPEKQPFDGLCSLGGGNYFYTLEQLRRQKDSLFKSSDRSPIPSEQRERFSKLNYFSVDSMWRLQGRYIPLPNALAPVVGRVEVELPSLDSCTKPARLLVYGGKGGETYIAFWDSTAAYGLTYEGGRYVPVEIQGQSACLDFNRAYFPYCAYNPNYICLPYPPENRICLPIRAGERW
ncbi:MAG: DUF1684 domain-containing protein [Bacteroidia bacterium]|nr:DUF1684 domain-containing protein [Bacteroidia bacterium]MCX7651769.1 DUF1684 domain-containing protein [Bacteroidia bacterium]MDW8416359.1 DUF1684 domain-containing protein [Bacteroidia bacterium]